MVVGSSRRIGAGAWADLVVVVVVVALINIFHFFLQWRRYLVRDC